MDAGRFFWSLCASCQAYATPEKRKLFEPENKKLRHMTVTVQLASSPEIIMSPYAHRPSRLVRSLIAVLSLSVVIGLGASIDSLAVGYVDQAIASLSSAVKVAQR